ncbi:MAG: integrin alpha [Polyangiales bacterium]
MADVEDARPTTDVPAAPVDRGETRDLERTVDVSDVLDAAVASDVVDVTVASDVVDAAVTPDVADAAVAPDVADATVTSDAVDATVMSDAVPFDADAAATDVTARTDVDPGALTPPRLRAPLSGTAMSTGRVTFRWFPVAGQDGVVEVCPDARCTTVARVLPATPEGVATPTVALAQGPWWWRVRPSVGGVRGLTPGATWHFVVEGRGTAEARAVGLILDPDADGRRDLYVGAWRASMGAGEVRVWIRTADLLPGQHRVLGPVTQRGAGWAVASAGDLTGDGLPEVAYSVMTSPNENGEVVVVRGSRDGSQRSLTTLNTGADDLTYGAAIAGLGDVDGDGFGDIAVGRPSYFADRDGTVFVYSGAADGLRGWDGLGRPVHSAALRGASTRDNGYGRALAGVGDLDGDGYADLVVGAPPRGTVTPGEVCVHRGGPSGLSATPRRIPAPQGLPATFGYTVAGAGDLNGDGYADFAVSGGTRADPQVFVFYGGPSGPRTTPDAVLRPPEAALNFGGAVVGVGDIDRDGWADLAVGAATGTTPGRVYIYRGGASGVDVSAPYALRNAEASVHFGIALGGRGDVDGDGVADLVVGDPYFDAEAGRIWVFRGATGGVDAVRWRALDGTANGERFGQSL